MAKSLMILLFAATAGLAGTAAADADPTLDQVYQAADNGHLQQAQQMMSQVLKDHPNSAKAHYVEAELDAKGNQFAAARDEFHTAERLQPGLPFAKTDSVNALRAELFPAAAQAPLPVQATTQTVVTEPVRRHHSGFPFGTVIVFGFLIWLAWRIFFRPRVINYGGGGFRGGPDGYVGGGPGPYYGGGAGYGAGYGGGGIGSSLASGLAVGAGVAVGEELTERLLDGGGRERVIVEQQPVQYVDEPQRDPNPDMGGNDFGVSDSGGGWDDNSGGGDSGGGSDW